MDNPKLKENCCGLIFTCQENPNKKDCVYRENKLTCKYLYMGDYCRSAVANVNRIMLHAKHIGLELTAKGFNHE